MDSFVGLFSPDKPDKPELFSPNKPEELWEPPCTVSPLPEVLPPESAEGNIEYKLKLVNITKSRFEHLVTQMKWRLREGQGEAIYAIGVTDGGKLIGLCKKEMDESLDTLYRMAEKLGADVTVLRERPIHNEAKVITELLIRKVPDDQHSIELRVAVLGSSDVGKSTLLGVLTQGEYDNGHGSARLNLFRHPHEIQSGRTSSISQEIMGFDSDGIPQTYNTCHTAESICSSSVKLITFIDLAGHQKYMKTTVFGLTGQSPHFAVLVVSAAGGMSGTAEEHLRLAMVIDLPLVVVINKIDVAGIPPLQKTIELISKVLQSLEKPKVIFQVKSEDDAITAASALTSDKMAPVFTISCVTGDGIPLFYKFLNVLPPTISVKERENIMSLSPEFQIEDVFNVPDVGTVVSGLLIKGKIPEGCQMFLGPSDDGDLFPAQAQSIHRHGASRRVVRAGESATVAIKCPSDVKIRKGMVLIKNRELTPICSYFQARITVLFHSSVIRVGFEGVVHIGNIRQTARIIGIMAKPDLSTNDTSSVIFRFVQRPEYVNPGSKLLLCMGQTKAIGRVIQVFSCHQDDVLKIPYVNNF